MGGYRAATPGGEPTRRRADRCAARGPCRTAGAGAVSTRPRRRRRPRAGPRADASTCGPAATRCTPPPPAPARCGSPRPHPPDAVVLDLGLPDLDGSEVIAGLRGWTDVPILVLSAREQSAQKVAALDAGADDYVVKPFGMDELLARLRAAIRRGSPPPAEPDDRHRRLHVDLAAGRVTARRRRHPADARPSGTCWRCWPATRAGWSTTAGCSPRCGARRTGTRRNYLRVYMATLRRKLEPDAARPRHLLTEAGRGLPLRAVNRPRPPATHLDTARDHGAAPGHAPPSQGGFDTDPIANRCACAAAAVASRPPIG